MPDRPNILLITTDQQRFDTIHAAGNPFIRTPHLNWLADSGIRFANCYTDCPICMPARATIMTGQHAFTHGQLGNTRQRPIDAARSLPAVLSQAGYQTRAQGKMHWEPLRANYGFEHMEILPDYYRHMRRSSHLGTPKDHGVGENEMEPVISTVPANESLTHWTVERSIEFLETRDETRPFFLWTSFAKPHPPLDPCRDYWLLYQNAPMPPVTLGDWSADWEDIPASFREPTCRLNNVQRFSQAAVEDVRRAYYACITHIDYSLGLLFARMRELGLLENTWIFFTSDHGEMLGDHHLGAKCVFLEGSAHVPMLVRPPGDAWKPDDRAGTVRDELACLADLMPTILSATGTQPEVDLSLDGQDLFAGERREDLIGRCNAYAMVHDGRHKYTFTAEGGEELLFDLAEDPAETRDLIRAGAPAGLLDRMRTRLAEHFRRTGCPAERDGRPVATGPAPDLGAVRAACWPGFHSRDVPTDVLH